MVRNPEKDGYKRYRSTEEEKKVEIYNMLQTIAITVNKLSKKMQNST